MRDILYGSGSVKRADVRLKTKYYGIKTKLYLMEENHYALQLISHNDMYDEIKRDFEYSMRSVGDWIEFIKDVPKDYLFEIEPLSNIAEGNEGIFLNHSMLESLLVSKFYDVDILEIDVKHDNGIILNLYVGSSTSDSKIKKIQEFILSLKLAFTDVIIKKRSVGTPIILKDVKLACTDRNFDFSKTDAAFWFDNVEKIYSGEIGKEELRFFDCQTSKCFMDFSVFDNENINIRSNIMLYDTTYIAFPLEHHITDFLKKQHLDILDLEELVSKKKLVVFLPNTESRYDRRIIERLYKVNPNSVVSKRGINALMAMFYCELERKYMSFWKGQEEVLALLCKDSIRQTDERIRSVYEMILWPFRTKRESYELLTSFSPLQLPTIGVNNLLKTIIDELGEKEGNKLEFEFLANSNAIHIATALQATYFPFSVSGKGGTYSDDYVSNILGNILNSYQYMKLKQQQSISNFSKELDNERRGIYLLKPNNSVSMKNILDYTEKYNTTETLKNILHNISKLDTEEQVKKISEYNNLIAEIGKENMNMGKMLSYVLSGAGFLPIVGIGASIIDLILKLSEDLGMKRKIVNNKIELNNATLEDEVYLLDKLSRVAKISF